MTQDNSPLPPGLPHIAYVTLWYPLFTQPFIFREVECLRRVLPLKVYTLYGSNFRHCSEEMRHAPSPLRHGVKSVPALCRELVRNMVGNPGKLWRMFKRSCLYRWPGWEIFGENFWAFFVGVKLARNFVEDGIDFVYAPWPRGAATAAWVGASLAGIPFATAARGDNLEPADPDLAKKLEGAKFIRANNEADRIRIENFGNGEARGKTRLVYNSLSMPDKDALPAAERFGAGPFRLLALGRFDVTKGFDVLIKACSILKDRGLNFRLTLAGGGGRFMGLGKMDNTLRELRKSLCLENEITMPGLFSHDDLPRMFAGHDIFVAPCVIHESGRRDGIPNTVIEAMSRGMPVVSTNINALPELVRDGRTGLTVEPDDPSALAEAIIWLCEHPDKAKEFGENGALLAARMFDPMNNAKRLAEIFISEHAAWKNGAKIEPDKRLCAE